MTAAEVKAALRRRHGADTSKGEWTVVEEAFSGFASGGGGGIDSLAIGAWKTAKVAGCAGAGRAVPYPIVAYEVKVSRADMRRELYGYVPGPRASWRSRPVPPWPRKALMALARSHFFVFAVPRGLLTDAEMLRREPHPDGRTLWVPEGAGLAEVHGAGVTARVEAQAREARPWTPAEVAEVIRHAVNPNALRRARERIAYLEWRLDWRGRAEEE